MLTPRDDWMFSEEEEDSDSEGGWLNMTQNGTLGWSPA